MKASILIATGALLTAGCATTQPSEAELAIARCEAVAFDIVVGSDEDLALNGAPVDLAGLRVAARQKALACQGVTPRGTYEGPNHVTVIASMIWPILREELPDLELEDRIRQP